MTDRLKRIFRARLIQTANGLCQEEREQLLFYCTDHIDTDDSFYSMDGRVKMMKLFTVLENRSVISWKDVSFLTEFLREVSRIDLALKLEAFELTRELMFYVMKRQSLLSFHSIPATESSVGLCLVEVDVKDVQDGEVERSSPLVMEVGFRLGEIWDEVSLATSDEEETVAGKKWANLTLRVAFAEGVIKAKLHSKDRNEALLEDILDMATKIVNSHSSKIAKLGTWKEFCDFVRKRYSDRTYHGREKGYRDLDYHALWKNSVRGSVKIKGAAFLSVGKTMIV